MNACNQCTETKPVPTCIDLLTIGTGAPNANYWVYIKNNASGFQERQSFTTDGNGLIKLDFTALPEGFCTENFYYTIWATEEDASINDYASITIDSVEYDCFTTRFERVYEDETVAEYTNYMLTV